MEDPDASYEHPAEISRWRRSGLRLERAGSLFPDPKHSRQRGGFRHDMIGLAESQTLRLSIIAFPPQPGYPPGPTCIAQLGFANSSGGPVGPSKTVNPGPGQ